MNKRIAYVDAEEWNRKTMRFIWIAIGIIVAVELLLYIMYQPVPECSKSQYFKTFVVAPTIVQVFAALVMELISKMLYKKIGEKLTSIGMLVGEVAITGIMMRVHSSVPFMCMVLLYPVIFTSVYRWKNLRYLAVGLGICYYAATQLGILSSTRFLPENNDAVYIIIFAAFIVATSLFVAILNSVVVGFEDSNQELLEQNKVIKENIKRDSMTGLYNHNAFYEYLNEYVHTRNGTFSIIIMDIDDFKKVNDTYGHAAGDVVIQQIVALIRRNIRKEDIAARYGGEEFVVLLPGTELAMAGQIAERIRMDCEACQVEEIKGHVTISLGVIEADSRQHNGRILFQKADDALYEAKRNGKNQVICKKI